VREKAREREREGESSSARAAGKEGGRQGGREREREREAEIFVHLATARGGATAVRKGAWRLNLGFFEFAQRALPRSLVRVAFHLHFLH
jgi:hypothetical protein